MEVKSDTSSERGLGKDYHNVYLPHVEREINL